MSITKNTRLKFETTSSRLTTQHRKSRRRRRRAHETPINKGRKHKRAVVGRNAKNSNQLKTLGTLDDCRRNALACRSCGICGIFSPKGRERIGRAPERRLTPCSKRNFFSLHFATFRVIPRHNCSTRTRFGLVGFWLNNRERTEKEQRKIGQIRTPKKRKATRENWTNWTP